MKRLLVASLLVFITTPALFAGPRDDQWRKVDEAINKGLPRTAIEALEPIIAGALKDRAYGEAAKAIARKIVLEGNIEGNKPEEKITRMETEITRAPREIVSLLRTIQANWYWHYFQQNRWRFMQRTATAQAPGKDFTTWDLPRLFAEIEKVFGQALADPATLKKTPIATFDGLLDKGTVPDACRPTLYDFIAQEALKFYTSGEQAAAKPEDAFEISADSPIFGSGAEFLAWKPQTTDVESPKLKAIRLYQDLLRFHQRDDDPTAFADVDLARLAWGNNAAFGETKNDRYKAALKAFVDPHADHEISALALCYWARVLQQEKDFVGAHRLATRGVKTHPNSVGGKMCRNLITDIEAKSAAIITERVWNRGASFQLANQDNNQNKLEACPTITVRYRNVTEVHFRAVAWDWNEFLQKNRSRPEWLDDRSRKELMARRPVLEWSAKLPPTPDYKERAEQLPAPDTLEPGFYFIVASHDPTFTEQNNQVTYADVWVSGLALVVRPHEKNIEGFVLEANSGEPVKGAEIMAWYLDDRGNRVPNAVAADVSPRQAPADKPTALSRAQPRPSAPEAAQTDDAGFFSIPSAKYRQSLLRVRAKLGDTQHELATSQEYGAERWREDMGRDEHTRTIFFTDRALYRPGQTIQYKGICVRVDRKQDNYETLAGHGVTVVFLDPNGKEVARAEHRSNDYGSFSGSFTAPRDRVTGRMRIGVLNSVSAVDFNVEEYKRPKFRVALDAPKIAPKLNDKVSLPGKAESYTGAAVDGAVVKWRVVREVRWPWWCWWGWRSAGRSPSQEIAHGSLKTATDGAFNIEFLARPDPTVSEKDEASFTFTIYADVTDSAGETRSADRRINVGFTALSATLTADNWQTDDKPIVLKIRTATLDDEAQTAKGAVKVYRLKEPGRVRRAQLAERYYYPHDDSLTDEKKDLSDPNNWELADVAAQQDFATAASGETTLQFKLARGVYRAILETQDRFGKKVTARQPLQVLQPADTKLGLKVPHLVAAPKWELEPGREFVALWGTGYEEGRAFIEIEHRHKFVQRFWTKPGQTQQQVALAVTEAMRGGFTLHVTQVRENRAYLLSRQVAVPWSNRDLAIKWEHFTSKLQPGQKETWTAIIENPKSKIQNPKSAERAVAEMVAALYDESLDQFLRHEWPREFDFFRHDDPTGTGSFVNAVKQFQHLRGYWRRDHIAAVQTYRQFPHDLVANFWGYQFAVRRMKAFGAGGVAFDSLAAPMTAAPAPAAAPMPMEEAAKADVGLALAQAKNGSAGADKAAAKRPDLGQVTARKNLNETAFFFPHLVSDKDGTVRMTFTMPEALTSWRFLGFAHDRDCRSGCLEGKTVTAKDLMVQPNPPRFLREGDVVEFTVKVTNQTDARQTGRVRLTFNDARTEQGADKLLGLQALGVPPSGGNLKPAKAGTPNPEIEFEIPAKESRSCAWRIQVPDGAPFLTYKAVASTGKVSDGEEGYLPVLARRILVTESLPLPIRGPATKKFEFDKLLKSGQSSTLRHQSLTVQMVSNPAWYAVLALPYLMEFPHECTEQTFNRFYANALARFIANSDPKIRRVFDLWKGTPALDSPLEKNQDLKSVMLEETPWLRQAQNESRARKNVGILFDANRLDNETERTLQKLSEAQLPDGAWPWFPGGRGNDYITLYITTGFGRLRHLGGDIRVDAAIRSLARLDGWMDEHYRQILKWPHPEDYVPSSIDALYLYGRSFFLKDRPVAPPHQQAVNFFLAQSRKFWLKIACRQSQGHLAIALQRFGNKTTAQDIMKSIKERSVTNEEMGMFWRETELNWWWYRAPIETQALMIEAFDEVMGDAQAVEECRVWLLKQKQTQDWKTTKATADAVYALLLRGKDVLASDKLVEVTVGDVEITSGRDAALRRPPSDEKRPAQRAGPTPAVEPGTGFYEKRFSPGDIKPEMGKVTVKKVDDGVAWGSVHWQYLEDMTKITPYESTPLKLKKSLYTKVVTKKGPVLEPVKGAIAVGDELVVRIELRVDRDMEYVHLKDQRGSGTEPVSVLSQYKYQDGLAYYESTRDTASHFFIDYLPKGTYVFEYSTRVQLRGQYQTGIASIQCMYAPEFNSHSESIPLTVK